MIDRIDVNILAVWYPLPAWCRLRQKVRTTRVDNIPETVADSSEAENAAKIEPGHASPSLQQPAFDSIQYVKPVVDGIKSLGGEPFLFPAGQPTRPATRGPEAGARRLRLNRRRCRGPIRATMDPEFWDRTGNRRAVSRCLPEADGIVAGNRIKPHTSFRGDIESGRGQD